MSYELKFSKLALKDFDDAVGYYESEKHGLSYTFITLLQEKLEIIHNYPHIFPAYRLKYRRSLLKKFPYAIYFEIKANKIILIVSVIHQSRGPEYIKSRLH